MDINLNQKATQMNANQTTADPSTQEKARAPRTVLADIEDIAIYEKPTSEQLDRLKAHGQVEIPIGYLNKESPLEFQSIELVTHKWLPAAAEALRIDRLTVMVVDEAVALQYEQPTLQPSSLEQKANEELQKTLENLTPSPAENKQSGLTQ